MFLGCSVFDIILVTVSLQNQKSHCSTYNFFKELVRQEMKVLIQPCRLLHQIRRNRFSTNFVGKFGELAARGNQDSVEIVFFFSLLSSSQLQSFAVFFLLLTTDYLWQLLLFLTLIVKAHQLYSKIVDMFWY